MPGFGEETLKQIADRIAAEYPNTYQETPPERLSEAQLREQIGYVATTASDPNCSAQARANALIARQRLEAALAELAQQRPDTAGPSSPAVGICNITRQMTVSVFDTVQLAEIVTQEAAA